MCVKVGGCFLSGFSLPCLDVHGGAYGVAKQLSRVVRSARMASKRQIKMYGALDPLKYY